MKFIKLTEVDSTREGETIYINPELITYIYENSEFQTFIRMNQDNEHFTVSETPEQIMEMIKEMNKKND